MVHKLIYFLSISVVIFECSAQDILGELKDAMNEKICTGVECGMVKVQYESTLAACKLQSNGLDTICALQAQQVCRKGVEDLMSSSSCVCEDFCAVGSAAFTISANIRTYFSLMFLIIVVNNLFFC